MTEESDEHLRGEHRFFCGFFYFECLRIGFGLSKQRHTAGQFIYFFLFTANAQPEVI